MDYIKYYKKFVIDAWFKIYNIFCKLQLKKYYSIVKNILYILFN